MAQKVIWHPNMAPSFLLLHVIINENSLKFTQIGRLLSASRASPQKHVPTTLVGIPVDIYTLTLPYGLDTYVTQLLTNLLTKPSVFYYLPIVACNLVSIKLLLLLLLTRANFSPRFSDFLKNSTIRFRMFLLPERHGFVDIPVTNLSIYFNSVRCSGTMWCWHFKTNRTCAVHL